MERIAIKTIRFGKHRSYTNRIKEDMIIAIEISIADALGRISGIVHVRQCVMAVVDRARRPISVAVSATFALK